MSDFITTGKLCEIKTYSLNKQNGWTQKVPADFEEEKSIPLLSNVLLYQYQKGFSFDILHDKKNQTITSKALGTMALPFQEYLENAVGGSSDFEYYLPRKKYTIPTDAEFIEIYTMLSIWDYWHVRSAKIKLEIRMNNVLIDTLTVDTYDSFYYGALDLKYVNKVLDTKINIPDKYLGGVLEIIGYVVQTNGNKAEMVLFQAQGGNFLNVSFFKTQNNIPHDLDYEIEVLYFDEV